MEIRQLEHFLIVCEELHVTRAADRIGISQPTLSQQIRALEEELDVPLFDRIGKKIRLTQAGALLLEHGTRMVRNMQNAKDAIAELRRGHQGLLTVGVLPSDLDYRMTKLLVDFHAEFPGVKLKVVSSIDVFNLVLDNEVDLGIWLASPPDDRLIRIPLCREEYVLVVSENHEWANRDSVSIEDLRGIRTVMYPQGYTGRELVDDCCRKRGFVLDTIMETGSATSIMSLVKANIGGTVQPLPLMEAINDPTLRCIPFHDEAPFRDFDILRRSDRFLGKSAQAFIQKTADYFKERCEV